MPPSLTLHSPLRGLARCEVTVEILLPAKVVALCKNDYLYLEIHLLSCVQVINNLARGPVLIVP